MAAHMAPSLFDVEDVTEQPRVRDMIIGPVSAEDVREFARRYNYTGASGSVQHRWGLWDGFVLHGVVMYNLPTHSVCASLFGEEHFRHVWHMARLVLSDESPRNSESRLVGGSLRAISRQHPDVWAVLTYAATDAGHVGYVYQATNALYTGTGGEGESFFLDTAGTRWADRDGSGFRRSATDTEARGWTRHRSGPKHRYVYILGNRRQRRERLALLRFPVLPYPKAVNFPTEKSA